MTPAGIEPATFRFVAQHLNHCATAVPHVYNVDFYIPFRRSSKRQKTKLFFILFRRPVTLYGCETRSLTLREERRLRVFENRVLRRIFGPRRDEITEDWRQLYYEVHIDLYTSHNIFRVINSRRVRLAGRVARMGRGEAYARFRWGNLK